MCNIWYSDYMQRVVVYVPQDTHKTLKSVLALQGLTVSEWFRNKVAEELVQPTEKISTEKKVVYTSESPITKEEFHTCSWNKAYRCKSPATIKVKSRWFCAPHA